MRNQYILLLTGLLAPVFFCGCSSSPGGSVGCKTIPLKDYLYEPATLPSGTEINILAYSGGKDEKGSMYYSQFIGTEKSGDTVRILCAWIKVSSGNAQEPTLTPAKMYDGNKGVRDATFVVPDGNDLTIIKLAANLGSDPDKAKLQEALADTAVVKNEYVILQDEVPLFKGNYKTAIGLMSFKQQPW